MKMYYFLIDQDRRDLVKCSRLLNKNRFLDWGLILCMFFSFHVSNILKDNNNIVFSKIKFFTKFFKQRAYLFWYKSIVWFQEDAFEIKINKYHEDIYFEVLIGSTYYLLIIIFYG